MKEDLFREMMARWGVKPSGKHKAADLPGPPAEPEPPSSRRPSPAPAPPPEPAPEDPDDLVFQRAMRNLGVRGDGADHARHHGARSEEGRRVEPSDDAALFMEALAQLEGVPLKDTSSDSAEAGLRKLRSVKQPSLGDTLDLHGMTVHDALNALASFVAKSFAKGAGTVMVITGKGLHSKGGVAVLRPSVEQWILQRGKRFVASYGEAPRAYGGRGAFVLYLRTS